MPETLQELAVKPADIICAFNFSVCLLHKRSEVLAYFKGVRSSLCSDPGGIFVLDLTGGHSVETVAHYKCTNCKTGIRCGALVVGCLQHAQQCCHLIPPACALCHRKQHNTLYASLTLSASMLKT